MAKIPAIAGGSGRRRCSAGVPRGGHHETECGFRGPGCLAPLRWEKSYAFEGRGADVAEAPGGEFLALGSTTAGTDFLGDVFVSMIGPAGTVRWQKAYGQAGEDYAGNVRAAADGNYLVAATSSAGSSGYRPWLLKIDPQGQILWQRRYGSDLAGGWSAGVQLEPTPDGGCILAASDNWLLKLDTDGNPQWQKRYAHVGFGQSLIEFVSPAPGGGYVAAGYKPPLGESNMHAWVMRLDEQGNIPGASFVWRLPIPADNRSACLVKVKGFDADGRPAGTDRSDSVFTIRVVELTQPSGQSVEGGTDFTVQWETFGTSAPVRSAALFFSRDGGAAWEKLVELPGNPGSHVWRVPQAFTAEGVIRVRLKDRSGNTVGHDDGDPFRIYLKP